ncbi:hypothetical protein ACTXT7_003609 [Hymenolepis weldensis]
MNKATFALPFELLVFPIISGITLGSLFQTIFEDFNGITWTPIVIVMCGCVCVKLQSLLVSIRVNFKTIVIQNFAYSSMYTCTPQCVIVEP